MLGLKVDLTRVHACELRVGHTPERKEELRQKIDSILADGHLDAKEAERLRGRMVFFEGYTFGRVANAAIKNLGRFCTGSESKRKLDNSLKLSLLTLRDRVLTAPLVSISVFTNNTWIIFTDGACNLERREGSVGGLLLDPCGCCQAFFSSSVPDDVMTEFMTDSQNPIHELEVLPVLIAAKAWGKRYEGALIVYYIDNESARMAYVRGSGETEFASCMISDFVIPNSRACWVSISRAGAGSRGLAAFKIRNGTLEPWNPGTLEPWNPGTLEPWNPGTLEPWNPGTNWNPYNPTTLEPWNPKTLEPWNPGTMEP